MIVPTIEVTGSLQSGDTFDLANEKVVINSGAGTWYDRRGLPNPDRPDQIINYRAKQETERLAKREEDFWKEIQSRVKFTSSVEICDTLKEDAGEFDTVIAPQCIQNFGDIKINLK